MVRLNIAWNCPITPLISIISIRRKYLRHLSWNGICKYNLVCNFVTLFSLKWKCLNWHACVWINGNQAWKATLDHSGPLLAYLCATVATISIVTLISVTPADIWSITSPLTDIFLIKCHWFEPHLPTGFI